MKRIDYKTFNSTGEKIQKQLDQDSHDTHKITVSDNSESTMDQKDFLPHVARLNILREEIYDLLDENPIKELTDVSEFDDMVNRIEKLRSS